MDKIQSKTIRTRLKVTGLIEQIIIIRRLNLFRHVALTSYEGSVKRVGKLKRKLNYD